MMTKIRIQKTKKGIPKMPFADRIVASAILPVLQELQALTAAQAV